MVSCASTFRSSRKPQFKPRPWIALFATIGIIYGAAVSYAQKDVKKLVAYSSVSHLGFVMLGHVCIELIRVLQGRFCR
jgi:NADH-quinone oxidoreductase subunit M